MGPFPEDLPDPEKSGLFLYLNMSKKGVTLNLRTPEGRLVFADLVRVSDVVLDNFRPGVTARLGVDFDTLKEINPTIVCCSVSGFGADGPYSARPVFDSVVQAISGAMSVTGEPGGEPAVMGFAVTDIGGGYGATVGVLTALLARERTGMGQRVDLSLLDVQLTFQGHLTEGYLGRGVIPTAGGSVQSANLPNGAFRTGDGRYVQIHCATQKFYEELAAGLSESIPELEGLPGDERFNTMEGRRKNWAELKAVLDSAFAAKTAQEWMDALGERVPIAPVNNVAQALEDPQISHRNMVVEVDHPLAGKYRMPGNPIKMGQEEVFQPAPSLGQHNGEVLGDLLGYAKERIDAMKQQGVV
jgi:crotonobetainyl-CoA:carnitine CoA-transferase CaiB-like acyl-CoA transferase